MSALVITLKVDPDAGEPLVGLLAKALGRGELGISDLRIERSPEPALSYATGHAEGLEIKRLVAEGAKMMKRKLAQDAKPNGGKGKGRPTGMRNVDTTRGGAKAVIDRLQSGPATWAELRAALPLAGGKANSIGSLLVRLVEHDIIERTSDGKYDLKGTPT